MKYIKKKWGIVAFIIIIVVAITVFIFLKLDKSKDLEPNSQPQIKENNNAIENNQKEPLDSIDENPQNSISTQN